jgi:hypothetical protein
LAPLLRLEAASARLAKLLLGCFSRISLNQCGATNHGGGGQESHCQDRHPCTHYQLVTYLGKGRSRCYRPGRQLSAAGHTGAHQ